MQSSYDVAQTSERAKQVYVRRIRNLAVIH